MARNIYFSDKKRSEQLLYEDIVIEALKIYGQDLYYLPRDIVNKDDLLNEDVSSRFNSSYMIEMYVDNIEGFDGAGDLFTKFGVEIRDQATFTISKRRWTQAVKRYDNELTSIRPLEGDLVYVPFSRKLFQIMKVEHEMPFYQLNNLPTYKLQCELFEFNADDFDTGVAFIDEIERTYAYKYILEFQASTVATARATLKVDGSLDGIVVTDGGDSYLSAPTVTFSPPTTSPTSAQAIASANGESITGFTITNPGNFYKVNSAVTFPFPNPKPPFKFGDRAFQHTSPTQISSLGANSKQINNTGNRYVVSFWYWCQTPNAEHNVILRTGAWLLYHRTSDNKIVGEASIIGTEIISQGTIVPFNAATNEGFWNFVEIHFLDGSARIYVNGVTDIEYFFGSPVIMPFGDILYFGNATGNTINPTVTDGFVGYLDHYVTNITGDNQFREANPVPVSTIQQETDGDVLTRAQNITTFNNVRAAAYVTNNSLGQISNFVITEPGRGYTDTTYPITIAAPTGTAADYTATGYTLLDSDAPSVRFVYLNNTGAGYVASPNVTISSQLAVVDFTIGNRVYQQLANNVIISGEVTKYSDSDQKLHLININTSDGQYHDFIQDQYVHKDSIGSAERLLILNITEEQQLSNIDQNDIFGSEAGSFLDFTEVNPFGDPFVTLPVAIVAEEVAPVFVDATAASAAFTADYTNLKADNTLISVAI